ncbi:MAG: hypothetical protein QF788_05675 [SAR324 cluster bacterium]|nr:hypothetical protein [SAR324 cluster bacterium]
MQQIPPFENGKRYLHISQHYLEHFGEKVYKIRENVRRNIKNLKEKNKIEVKKNFKKIPMPFSIQAIDGGFLVQEDDWKIIDKDNLEELINNLKNDSKVI